MPGEWRRRSALIILIVGLCLQFSGGVHGSGPAGRETRPDPLSRVERSYIKAHGPIRYAPDPNFAPLEFFDREGRAEGITPDILNVIAEKLDIAIEVVRYPSWTDVLDAARKGNVDVLGSLSKTPERETFLDYSRSYIDLPYVLFVNENGPSVNSLEACRGKRLGVVTNYGIVDRLRTTHPDLTLSFVPDPETGLLDVATGRLDAFIETLPVGAYYVRKDALATIKIVPKPLYVMPQYLAVPKGDEVLLGILQKGLDSISPENYERLVVHWTGHSLQFRPWYRTRQAREAIVIFFLVVAALLVWVASLRHMVARHKRQLTVTEARLRRFVDRTQAAIYRTTPDGRILDCNGAFAEIFGFDSREAARKAEAWSLYASVADREEDLARLRTEGRLDNHEVRLLRKDGSEIIAIENETLVTSEGDEPVIEGVLLDVTALKKTQEALQTANTRLEEEIEHRARQEAEHLEMSAKIHQLQTLEAIGRLTQGLAHEVRNPLFALQVNVAALEKVLAQGNPPGPFIAHIQEHVGRLDKLMRDLMDLSRSPDESGKVECDLTELVKQACDSVEEGQKKKPVTITVESIPDPVTIEAPPQDIVQVFVRLLKNAADASFKNGRIVVTVSKEGDQAVARVTDMGSGIPEKLLPHLFEPFLSGKKGHGGLGLALARHFLAAHGGTVEAANNDPGPGATFTVRLPLSP
jgi:PAS domain S-box-containing protein